MLSSPHHRPPVSIPADKRLLDALYMAAPQRIKPLVGLLRALPTWAVNDNKPIGTYKNGEHKGYAFLLYADHEFSLWAEVGLLEPLLLAKARLCEICWTPLPFCAVRAGRKRHTCSQVCRSLKSQLNKAKDQDHE